MPQINKRKRANGSAGAAAAPPAPGTPAPAPAPGGIQGNTPPNVYTAEGWPNPKLMTPWEFMATLTADQWQDTIGYLYRIAPTMSRRSLGKEAYLLRFFEPITEEWVKKTYGGKEFRMDLMRRSGGMKFYSPFRFAIAADPILQPGEEIDAAGVPAAATAAAAVATANTSEAMSLVKNMMTDLMNQRDAAQQEGKQFDFEGAFEQSVQLLSRGSNAAIDVILEQSKRANSGDGGSAVLVVIMPMMLELIKQMGQRKDDPIMARVIEKAFAPPPDPLDQLDKMLSISEKLRGGGADNPTQRGWAGLADKAIDKLPQLLSQGKDLIDSAAAARAAIPRQPQPAYAAVTAPVPDSLHTNANPAALPGTDPGQAVIDHLKHTLVHMVLAGDSGKVGAQTADLIAPDYAEELRGILQRSPLALGSDPILVQCAAAPGVQQFIADYLAWFAEADEAERQDTATVGVNTQSAI